MAKKKVEEKIKEQGGLIAELSAQKQAEKFYLSLYTPARVESIVPIIAHTNRKILSGITSVAYGFRKNLSNFTKISSISNIYVLQ